MSDVMRPVLVTEAEVEDLVRDTACREGIEAPEVQWSDSEPAVTLFRGRTIVLRRTLLRDAGEARFVALHELGHVALGHQRRGPVLARTGALLLAIVGPPLAGVLLALSLDEPIEIGLGLGTFVAMALLGIVLRWVFQPCEYAADRWAADRGGVLTEEIARAAYGWPRPWVQSLQALTHPSPAQRVRRVRSALPSESADGS